MGSPVMVPGLESSSPRSCGDCDLAELSVFLKPVSCLSVVLMSMAMCPGGGPTLHKGVGATGTG